MVKKILIISIILILFLVFQPIADCSGIKNNFRISPSALMLQLEGDIHADTGMPILLVRLFHNKPIYTGREIIRRLLFLGQAKVLFTLPLCFFR